jgi:hypothetical protein
MMKITKLQFSSLHDVPFIYYRISSMIPKYQRLAFIDSCIYTGGRGKTASRKGTRASSRLLSLLNPALQALAPRYPVSIDHEARQSAPKR